MGLKVQTTPSSKAFRFGTYRTKSIGKRKTIIPTPSKALPVEGQVVAEDIPSIIGLNITGKYALPTLIVENALESVQYQCKLPLERKLGHLYMC